MIKFVGEFFGNPLAKAVREKATTASCDAPRPIPSPAVSLGYRYVGVQLIGAVVAVTACCWVYEPLAHWSVPLLIVYLSGFGLIALRLLTFGKTLSQAIPPRIIRQWRFLGLIPVWRREYPLKKYTGIQRRHIESRGRRHDSYCWLVGLIGPSDEFLPVQLFHSRGYDHPCPEVDAYASKLAEVTGLPLLDPIQV